jgi:PPOX class probable FMN-dependent enzyme
MTSTTTELKRRFHDVVENEDELRSVVGSPLKRALDKELSVIDDASRRFIAHAPFVFIASSSEQGILDISPKGDPAGFVVVLDERTLAIPDRLGNRRLDTFRNVLVNPHVALIFVIPGITYTLRASGEAIIVRDAELRDRMAVNGKAPDHALVVSITTVFSHCPKCMIRAGLWNQEKWPDTTNLPSFAETLIAHAKLTEPLEEVATMLETSNRDRLY